MMIPTTTTRAHIVIARLFGDGHSAHTPEAKIVTLTNLT